MSPHLIPSELDSEPTLQTLSWDESETVCECDVCGAEGLMTVNDSIHWTWSDISPVTGELWQLGGEWKPASCVARYRMAVIIPFRDRDAHLIALLRHLIPLLQRQMIHFRIFVVEQVMLI